MARKRGGGGRGRGLWNRKEPVPFSVCGDIPGGEWVVYLGTLPSIRNIISKI
jgi:hypothetical protein